MSIPFVDPYRRYRRWLKAAVLFFALGLPLVSTLAVAQEAPAVQGQELRRQIEKRYQVLPIRGGVVLTPRESRRGVRSIEVSDDAVAINGERVNQQIARDWLGEDARLILPLLDLEPAARRELFGMTAEAPERPETPETPETPEIAESPEPSEEETPEEIEVEAPESPELPEAPGEPVIHSGSRVKFGGNILVEKEEQAEEAVSIGGSVRVDGQVSRDVVAVGGPVRINGRVGGNVVSVGSSVYLGPGAVVEGDVNSVGGTIERSPGSQIHGSTSEASPPWAGPWRRDDGWDFDPDFGPFSLFGASLEAFGSIVWMVTLGLLTCLTLLIARRPLEQVDLRLRAEPLKSFLVGLAGFLASVPLMVVVLGILFVVALVLTILLVGCLLLVLLPFFAMALALALMLALVLGYSAAAYRTGRWLEQRFNRSFGGPYAAALVGVLVIQIWSVIGELLHIGPGALHLFAAMFVLVGGTLQLAAWMAGFGAVLLARVGAPTRFVPPPAVPATVPPPPPPAAYEGDLPLTDRSWEENPPER